jgi:xanthosine utilization system XapX-like protein
MSWAFKSYMTFLAGVCIGVLVEVLMRGRQGLPPAATMIGIVGGVCGIAALCVALKIRR